jgi:hypothetical protein
MKEIYNTTAPFVPSEAFFNEKAERSSKDKKGGLAAIFAANSPLEEKRLSFDQKHFEKFLREDASEDQNNINKRKRQNPLGDFKFKRINEYF